MVVNDQCVVIYARPLVANDRLIEALRDAGDKHIRRPYLAFPVLFLVMCLWRVAM